MILLFSFPAAVFSPAGLSSRFANTAFRRRQKLQPRLARAAPAILAQASRITYKSFIRCFFSEDFYSLETSSAQN